MARVILFLSKMYVDVLLEKGNELETFALVFESTTSVLNTKKKKRLVSSCLRS